ncbi:MAG: hypothetical protein M3120_03330 [Pseudomonadota bacterium]|nr:hypothetical protein [Pseudomonadota bacterium]
MSVFGVVIRESLFLIPFSFVFSPAARFIAARFSHKTRLFDLLKFAPMMFSLAMLAVLHSSISSSGQNGYSYFDTIIYFTTHKSFGSYLLGWYVAYGPVLAFILFNLNRCRVLLVNHPHLAVYLACVSVLAWVGGTDTERFLYWAMPVVYALIGRSIVDLLPLVKDFTLAFAVAITQIIGQRAIWIIPDYPGAVHYTWLILAPLGNEVKYLDLWSFHADPTVQAVSLIEHLVLTAALLLYLWYRRRLLLT